MSMKELRETLGLEPVASDKKVSSQLDAKRNFEQMTDSIDEKIYALAIHLMKQGLVENKEQAVERATKEISESQGEPVGRTRGQRYQSLGWNN